MGLFPTPKQKNWQTCRPSCSNTSCASLSSNMSTFVTSPVAASGYTTFVMEGGRSGDTSINSGAVFCAGFWWLFVLSIEMNLTLLLFMRSLELLISKCLLWGGFVYCELTGSCQPLTLCWCTKFIITPCRWLPSCNNNEAYNCLQLLQVAIYSPLHQMNSFTMNLYDLEC